MTTIRGEGENAEFTPEAIRSYLEDSSKCPFCSSTDIGPAFKQEFDGEEFHNRMGCATCKKLWWEIYKLTSLEPEH